MDRIKLKDDSLELLNSLLERSAKNPKTAYMGLVLNKIAKPTQDEYWLTELGHCHLVFIHYCVCEFWRQEFDRTFPTLKTHGNSSIAKIIKPEIILWQKVYRVLVELYAYKVLDTLPAVYLGLLVRETNGLLMPHFRRSCLRGIEAVKTQIQGENGKLKGLENPFSENGTPHSYKLIALSIDTAERLDRFRTRYYTPMVKARMSLASEMIELGLEIREVTDGNIALQQNRGRKPSRKKPH